MAKLGEVKPGTKEKEPAQKASTKRETAKKAVK